MATFDNFHEIQFFTTIQYVATAGPAFKTMVQTHRSGHESRVIEWTASLRRFTLNLQGKTQLQYDQILTFFYCRHGRRFGFRVQDPTDYRAHPDGVTAVSIGTGNGTTTIFQLSKPFTDAAASYVYNIYKPVNNGTLKVYVNGGLLATPADYSIDYATGLITFTVAPTNLHPITAYFEYDVPCRFDTDRFDGAFNFHNDMNWGTIPIVEIRPR